MNLSPDDILAGFKRWARTARLLQFYKRSEYLSAKPPAERDITRVLIGALLEFSGKHRIQYEELVKFLEVHGIRSDLPPDFQWEQKCLQAPRLKEPLVQEELFKLDEVNT